MFTPQAVASPLEEKTRSVIHAGMERGLLKYSLEHRFLPGVLELPWNANCLEPRGLPTALALTWVTRNCLDLWGPLGAVGHS